MSFIYLSLEWDRCIVISNAEGVSVHVSVDGHVFNCIDHEPASMLTWSAMTIAASPCIARSVAATIWVKVLTTNVCTSAVTLQSSC